MLVFFNLLASDLGIKTIWIFDIFRIWDKLGQELSETVSCAVLHGDVAQKGRERAMEAFRKVRTLSEPLNLDTSVDASA